VGRLPSWVVPTIAAVAWLNRDSLETLNISSCNLLVDINTPSEGYFASLRTLIMVNCSITSWESIDNLERWTDGALHNLRISLAGVDDVDDTGPTASTAPTKMTGRAKLDRPILIAKLSGLVTLNSTPITIAERKDAEIYYVKYVGGLSVEYRGGIWGRYDTLQAIYGESEIKAIKPASLRSKMISKWRALQGWCTALHVYPAQHKPFDLSVLPSAPTILLRRKVAKTCGTDLSGVRLWTTRGEEREMVLEVDDQEGREVGWWFRDGDDLVVDTG
jgi:hypothetical protein